MNRKIIDQVIIEGFQDFETIYENKSHKYWNKWFRNSKKLPFYSKKYKYRFIANSSLFSSAIKEDAKAIFITTNGLNDAKDMMNRDNKSANWNDEMNLEV